MLFASDESAAKAPALASLAAAGLGVPSWFSSLSSSSSSSFSSPVQQGGVCQRFPGFVTASRIIIVFWNGETATAEHFLFDVGHKIAVAHRCATKKTQTVEDGNSKCVFSVKGPPYTTSLCACAYVEHKYFTSVSLILVKARWAVSKQLSSCFLENESEREKKKVSC